MNWEGKTVILRPIIHGPCPVGLCWIGG